MKVVFLENVEGTAQIGEIKEVKNGFARNYLLPRGLAAPAIEPYLRRGQSRANREEKRQEALDGDAKAVAERIEGAHLTIAARVGEQGKLYGSITSLRIAEEVAKITGEDTFDHRKVLLPEAIKETGVQPVRLRLTRNVEASIDVEVIGEVEEEAEEEEATDEATTAEEEAPAAEAELEETAAEESDEAPAEAEESEADEAEAVDEEPDPAVSGDEESKLEEELEGPKPA